ncbi:MAG: hypothetical protein AB2L22_09660 [Syntrophales bacterium]
MALLNRQLMRENRPRVNAKLVYWFMKKKGLLLQRYTGRLGCFHEGRIRMNRSNRRWCSDAFEIVCWNRELI